MGDPISLIYIYGNYSEHKIVDPERYGYIDVVYDAYSMVLKDIPDGKTVNFSVKVFLSDDVKELVLGSDSDVLHMFHEYENEDQPIQCFVFEVEVSKEFFINYTVNGYHKSLMQRSSKTLVENSSFKNKKTVSRKTLCKRTDTKKTLYNSYVTIHGCGRDYVQRRKELTPDAYSSLANTQLVNLSSDEDCDSDDPFVDKQVGDEAVGDETVRDETVRDEDIGDEEMGDDDSVDSKWGKDSNEVGDDDSTNNEKNLEIDEDMGGVADSDGKLSDIKSDDLPDEIDCWEERNIDQTEKALSEEKMSNSAVQTIKNVDLQPCPNAVTVLLDEDAVQRSAVAMVSEKEDNKVVSEKNELSIFRDLLLLWFQRRMSSAYSEICCCYDFVIEGSSESIIKLQHPNADSSSFVGESAVLDLHSRGDHPNNAIPGVAMTSCQKCPLQDDS
ncbi:hypothetical protein NE237_005050 [Protea cynaroides]|uniref:Uncharacterized protein n=1 Tax=Protea cynaroides TaxID=273540 RepID=A0A9Q0KK35_9MAGN|nr:hypothetical protein NE237_005050 [Protea cynaroides]